MMRWNVPRSPGDAFRDVAFIAARRLVCDGRTEIYFAHGGLLVAQIRGRRFPIEAARGGALVWPAVGSISRSEAS